MPPASSPVELMDLPPIGIRDCEILSQSRAARGWMRSELIRAHSAAQMR